MCANGQSSHYARFLRCEHCNRFHAMLELSDVSTMRDVHTIQDLSYFNTITEFTLGKNYQI